LSAPSYTPQLRPLSIGEMLDAGFRLFRHRFGTLLACVLVPMVPLTILATIIIASTTPDAFDPNAPQPTEDDEIGGLFAGLLIAFVLYGVAAALAVAACFKTISAAYLGERATAGSSLRHGLRRFLPLVVAYFVIAIPTGFLGIFWIFIIPGVVSIWLGVKWSMTFPAIVAEQAGPFRAMGRSWALTRKSWWRTFATLLVVGIIAVVIYLAIGIGLSIALEGTADSIGTFAYATLNTLLTVISLAIIYPLVAAVMTVVYYDLRVRNEGFDLELLAKGVGADASPFERAPERPGPPSPGPAPSTGGFAAPEGPTAAS
jgi:MFS family permease